MYSSAFAIVPRALQFSLLVTALLAAPARAETVTVLAEPGSRGAFGASGNPGQDGADGGDGGSAHAVASTPGESNTASAHAGSGGAGGSGGNGVGSGAIPGDGGNGGDGGTATAEAIVSGADLVSADAIAGAAGAGGSPGRNGFTVGAPGLAGTPGDAFATASLTTDSEATVLGTANARGGNAAFSSFFPDGGNAEAILNVENTGAGALFLGGSRGAHATGGSGASGGSATTTAHAEGGGEVFLESFATGGRATAFPEGVGGDATAHATAASTGNESVSVTARAVSGGGNGSGAAGIAEATAHGSSSGGGDVTVTALQNVAQGFSAPDFGRDTAMHDAVSGSTAGLLTLDQSAVAGRGVVGGDARASLEGNNVGGGDLSVRIAAAGGDTSGFSPADGGSGIVESVRAVGNSAVDVIATAVGGEGKNGGEGVVLSAYGESTSGGAVSVRAVSQGGDAQDGMGADASLTNVVSGTTTGDLILEQLAEGGEGDSRLGIPAGIAGDAFSQLDAEHSGTSLTVLSESLGGRGQELDGPGNEGGRAEARASGINHSGSVDITTLATARVAVGSGASAIASAEGVSFGDDHAVTVGARGVENAVGGSTPFATNLLFADGGSSESRSSGIANGNSEVTVYDRALGGTAGFGGTGGAAESEAIASSAGNSNVVAHAVATGGRGGTGGSSLGVMASGGEGGSANATAAGSSAGGGEVWVTAEAHAGDGGSPGRTDQAGNGGSISLNDSVSGSTAGVLHLSVVGAAGSGADGFDAVGSSGGDVTASLDAENSGGGDLEIDVELRAGHAGDGDAGAGATGNATLGPIVGRSSTGADVTVRAEVRGGFGGRSLSGETDGGSVTLIDAVSGHTEGSLVLSQEARGGSGFGSSGDAHSELNSSTNSTLLSIETRAIAGFAGADGDATAISNAHNQGGNAGEASALALATAQAHNGGNALATAHATTEGDGAVVASSIASDDSGPFSAGDVVAHAFGSNAGAGAVEVSALASSGFGTPGNDGNATATAEGHSTGGGDVSVNATVLDRASTARNIAMHDAVSGSTSGRLVLTQSLSFGNLGFGGPGAGGDAAMSLTGSNAGGGDLALGVQLNAGSSVDGSAAGNAVLGDVVGVSTTGASVQVGVSAIGGQGGGEIGAGTVLQESSSGDSSRIFGESNGGDVVVSASFFGGSAGTGNSGVDGTSIEMDSIVDGDTTGALTLGQGAHGGRGQSGFESSGSGGSARSSLSKRTTSSSLSLLSSATGGNSGATFGASGQVGDAGDAVVIIRGANDGGGATAMATARGGDDTFGMVGGGSASADTMLTTRGDGNDIAIGSEGFSFSGDARGGSNTRRFSFVAPGSTLGGGGDATSRSVGAAKGNSVVAVYDTARGGHGSSARRLASATSGDGGRASSFGSASARGTSRVVAHGRATGGSAGVDTTIAGVGGDADAEAFASGLGEVESSAIAIGGNSDGGFFGVAGRAGAAWARARATGSTGFALADATTGIGVGPQLRAMSRAALAGSEREVLAHAGFNTELPNHEFGGPRDGVAFVTSDVSAADHDRARSGNTALAEMFVADPGAQLLALASWTGSTGRHHPGPLVLTTEFDLTLGSSSDDHRILMGVFDITSTGDQFVSLVFELDVNGDSQSMSFSEVDEVAAFFGNDLFQLGVGLDAGDMIHASFELTLGDRSGFGMGLAFAKVVPEPGTGVLLAFGLVVMTIRRQREMQAINRSTTSDRF